MALRITIIDSMILIHIQVGSQRYSSNVLCLLSTSSPAHELNILTYRWMMHEWLRDSHHPHGYWSSRISKFGSWKGQLVFGNRPLWTHSKWLMDSSTVATCKPKAQVNEINGGKRVITLIIKIKNKKKTKKRTSYKALFIGNIVLYFFFSLSFFQSMLFFFLFNFIFGFYFYRVVSFSWNESQVWWVNQVDSSSFSFS